MGAFRRCARPFARCSYQLVSIKPYAPERWALGVKAEKPETRRNDLGDQKIDRGGGGSAVRISFQTGSKYAGVSKRVAGVRPCSVGTRGKGSKWWMQSPKDFFVWSTSSNGDTSAPRFLQTASGKLHLWGGWSESIWSVSLKRKKTSPVKPCWNFDNES